MLIVTHSVAFKIRSDYSISLTFKNNYEKDIKHIYFSIVAINKFGELIEEEDQVHKLQFTGPLKVNEIRTSSWRDIYFYNRKNIIKEKSEETFINIIIVKIEIVFMDNTIDIISEDEIEYDDSILPKSEGCYIATCAYGSYDCPEVWTLRRFRDFYLKKKKWGKKIIKIYYKISPHLVAIFGKNKLFKKASKTILNTFVLHLRKKGYQNSEYKD